MAFRAWTLDGALLLFDRETEWWTVARGVPASRAEELAVILRKAGGDVDLIRKNT